MRRLIIPMVLVAAMFGQTPPAKSQASRTAPKQQATSKSGIDTVIELVQGGTPEALVIKSIQHQGTAYDLLPADVLKLKKAGVTENIINVMMDPKASVVEAAPASPVVAEPVAKNSGPASADPAPAPSSPPATGAVTPFPPDIEGVPAVHKRRLVVAPIDHAAAKEQVQYWFNRNEDVGEGIRSMLTSRMDKSENFVLLERKNLDVALWEHNFGKTSEADQGQKTRGGKVPGADYLLVGEVVAFGVGSTAKRQDIGSWLYGSILREKGLPVPAVGTFSGLSKQDKALVIINFRIINAETLEMIASDSARGESSHKSKEVQASVWTRGGYQNFGSGSMNSPDFQKTILGEATTDAVNKIAKQLEEKIAKVPMKPRKIEGRVASIIGSGVYLAIGANDGVRVGDRFEIRQINNEVVDPDTKDVIALEAVKVGELVVTEVTNDKASFGNYGGQPLSSTYAKGYQARLMSK